MATPSSPEPVDTVKDGYIETQPASGADVDEARRQDEVLGSSPRTESDQSLTGQSRPVDHEGGVDPGPQDRPS